MGLCLTYQKALRQFDRFVAGRPPEPLTTSVVAFIETTAVTPAYGRVARSALRARYPDDAIDWRAVPAPGRVTRDAARLRRTVLSEREYVRLRGASLTARERALLALLHVTRRAEVRQLRWGDLDLNTGSVYVRDGKGGMPGWTVLPPEAVPAVAAWKSCQPEIGPNSLVFFGPHGEPVAADTIGRWVHQALAKAGLRVPGRGAHAFRRSFATLFLRANPEQLRGLQVLMRHQSIATTVLYDYPNPGDFAGALRKLPVGLSA